MPTFTDLLELRRPWSDWIFLRQERDTQGGGGFHIHNPWGNSNQPQGAADRNRLEIGYRTAGGQDLWGQLVIHGPTGRVGVGLVNPQARLHVNGNLIVTGDIALPQADLAEQFAAAGEPAEPGTVVVLEDEGRVRACTEAYDRKVAGVVSGAGDYRPAIVLDKDGSRTDRAAVAMVGKVFCKVDAESGPVEVGDLLTTSATPGHAMKAADSARAFGAIVGKALRPLEGGRGLIPILVALQ